MFQSTKPCRWIAAASVLALSNCGPIPVGYLEYLNLLLSGNSHTIPIETGKKKTRGEFGVSFFSGDAKDSAAFSQNPIYYNQPEPQRNNCFLHLPSKGMSVHAIFVDKNLFCALVEGYYGRLGAARLSGAEAGLGVRLYSGPVYWRFFYTAGAGDVKGEVDEFCDDLGREYSLNHYAYTLRKPHIGLCFTANTHYPFPVNPFVDFKIRYTSLFNGTLTYFELLSSSTTVGIYATVGPTTWVSGFRLEQFYKDRSKRLHPSFLTQGTFILGDW